MNKMLLFFFLGFSFSQLYSQEDEIITFNLKPEAIPKDIVYKGLILESKKWDDKNGTNLFVISRYGPYETTGPSLRGYKAGNVDLYFYQYSINGDKTTLLWKSSDSIRGCGTDMWIECFPNSTSITDLDNNGFTETTIVFRYSCRGGVDPSFMKVILHENKQSYELKGLMYVPLEGKFDKTTFDPDLSNVSEEGVKRNGNNYHSSKDGRFENDYGFNEAPLLFLKHAKDFWLRYCDQDSFVQFHSGDYTGISK
jgi:hypothetical protein